MRPHGNRESANSLESPLLWIAVKLGEGLIEWNDHITHPLSNYSYIFLVTRALSPGVITFTPLRLTCFLSSMEGILI